MLVRRTVSLLVFALLALAAVAIPAQAAVRHIDGTVVSKNSENHSFRIRTQSGNQLRIKVTPATKFQRLAGFNALHKGLRIEVEAKSTSNGLVAIQIDTPGGGSGGGTDNNGGGGGGGGADGPNHT